MSWGYHLRVNAIGSIEKITNYQNVSNFSIKLVEAIKMVAYGAPQIYHFAEHDEGKAGFTLVQLIETSSITAHFVDATGEIYLDIFSCKEFDSLVALDVVEKYFEIGANFNSDYIERQAGVNDRGIS